MVSLACKPQVDNRCCNTAPTADSEASVASATEADGSWCDKEAILLVACFSLTNASPAESVETNFLLYLSADLLVVAFTELITEQAVSKSSVIRRNIGVP